MLKKYEVQSNYNYATDYGIFHRTHVYNFTKGRIIGRLKEGIRKTVYHFYDIV